MSAPDLFMRRSAEISPCGNYRYWLEREWEKGKTALVTVMLNPSTADADREDPTLLALIHFARSWGYGGLVVVNLYAWRSPSPAEMMREPARMGPDNRRRLNEAMLMAAVHGGAALAAWGNDGNFEGEADWFTNRATNEFGINLLCLGTTQSNAPKHPLARGQHFIPRDQEPKIWRSAA